MCVPILCETLVHGYNIHTHTHSLIMSYNLPYIAKFAGPTIGDATKEILREYAMTGSEIGRGKDCDYTFAEFAEFVRQKVGDDIWNSLKFPTSAIYKAVAEYKKEKKYQVEYIVSSNGAQGADRKWFVKWEGYDESHNTWEPIESFTNPALTEAFDSYEEGTDSDEDPLGHLDTHERINQLYREVDTRDDKIHMLKIKIGKRDNTIEELKSQINRLKQGYKDVARMFDF